jgi:ATP-binding cassette, subfamily B, bacterial
MSASRSIRTLLKPVKWAFGTLALLSLTGGFLEAIFLVLVTRIAFAATENAQEVIALPGTEIDIKLAIGAAFGLVLARVAVNVLSAWRSASLTTSVIVQSRRALARAYLEASWEAQHGERSGKLQELLTTFSQRGADLVHALTLSVAFAFSLLALLASAVLVDPSASLAIIGAVIVL